LKFTTPGGKIVYGGGGIMPDVFVPIDTSSMTSYLTRLRSMGLMYRYAFDFTDKNRSKLVEFGNYQDVLSYLENNTRYFEDFIKYAESKGVKPVPKEISISEEVIRTQIKAFISRNLFDNEGFYPILKDIDNTLLKALEIIES
jgi:carboxyl-terminal processing protease